MTGPRVQSQLGSGLLALVVVVVVAVVSDGVEGTVGVRQPARAVPRLVTENLSVRRLRRRLQRVVRRLGQLLQRVSPPRLAQQPATRRVAAVTARWASPGS